MRHTTHATKPSPMPAPIPSMRRHRTGSAANRATRALVTALLISLPLSGCGSSAPKTAATTPSAGVSVTPLSADQVESERNHFDVIVVGDLPTRYGIVRVDNSQVASGAKLERAGVVTSYKPGSTGHKPDIKGLQWASRIEPAVFDHEYQDSSDDWSTTQKNTFHLLEQESSGVGVVSPDGQHISLILQPHRTAQDDDFSAQRTYVVVLSAETGTLEILYHGKSVSDVLDMTVHEALAFFANIPRIKNKLQTLHDVGLGYIHLGQPATTLSGGEAQRVKLAKELHRQQTGKTLYILDEPTTGLHFEDVRQLIVVLERLVDAGNTVLVIEHNLDVIKMADRIIDMGPEGGDGGGTVVVSGTPEKVAATPESHTGKFLKEILDRDNARLAAEKKAQKKRA